MNQRDSTDMSDTPIPHVLRGILGDKFRNRSMRISAEQFRTGIIAEVANDVYAEAAKLGIEVTKEAKETLSLGFEAAVQKDGIHFVEAVLLLSFVVNCLVLVLNAVRMI